MSRSTSPPVSTAHPPLAAGLGPEADAGSDGLAIREDVLRDPRYPVHKIADRLLPYLRVLVERFHPQQVILFGSYAYGEPNEHSDVDLLIVKEVEESPLRDKIRIRKGCGGSPLRGAR